MAKSLFGGGVMSGCPRCFCLLLFVQIIHTKGGCSVLGEKRATLNVEFWGLKERGAGLTPIAHN